MTLTPEQEVFWKKTEGGFELHRQAGGMGVKMLIDSKNPYPYSLKLGQLVRTKQCDTPEEAIDIAISFLSIRANAIAAARTELLEMIHADT